MSRLSWRWWIINNFDKLSYKMKTFKKFLDESSLARIKSKSDKGGMAALSASEQVSLQRKIVQEQSN